MRKAHVKVFPLGAIVFVLVLLGGVFPSMAQALGLTINFGGSGTGRVEANSPGTDTLNIFSSNTLDYDQNSSVTLTATPTGIGASQSVFSSWAGCANTSGNQCTVVMNASKAVTVTFNLVPVNLTINFGGSGTGQVAGSGAGTDSFTIFASNTISYDHNDPPSSVVLTATPTGLGTSQSTFGSWTGCASTSGNQCTVVMNANRTVSVTFNLVVQRTLTVTKAGTGSGTVTSAPGGISCGGDCTQAYANGTAVTLTAAASTGSTFGGWSGGGCAGTGTCAVSMTAAQAVTATFTTVQRTLTVTKAGTGSGTVTSAPGGISCGGDCSEGYANGTTVTLTAAAGTGSTFGGWSGGGCTGTGTCTVSMTAAQAVTATFTQNVGNQPPSVNAGPSITIALPNSAPLTGTVTDDGLPATPGRVTSTWSKVSGPGTVTFANASALSTTASFSEAGTYVLRLSASDGELLGSSDLTITANNLGARRLSNDLNADGTADLLWRNSLNGLVVGWLMKDAAIATTGVFGSVPSDWQIRGMGDVNADGQADVIWRNTTTGAVAVWLMDGLTHTSTGLPGTVSLNFVIKGIGDVDGNGTADIVWHNTVSGALAIWLMNGSTIANSGFPGSVPVQWEIAGVGDVNADEKADVIWRNTTTGAVAVWLMDGLTHTSTGFPGSASLSYVIKKIGDVDGNGTADIVWHNSLNGAVAIWIMNGTKVAFAGFPGGVPPEWQITGMGDVNADGQDDVIWQNRATGAVALWLMNGTERLRTEFPRGTSTDWEIQ